MQKAEIGSRFTRWLIVGDRGANDRGLTTWLCRCDCGTTRNVMQNSLRSNTSKSCGCLNKEESTKKHTKHGDYMKPEYKVWTAMKCRCLNLNNPRFDHYGGRGVGVCDSWMKYTNFIADMGYRPSTSHSLDRIDNDKGYSPENCKWSLPHEQMTNRSMTRFVETIDGLVPLATLAKNHGIPANTLRARVLSGMPIHEALTRTVRKKAANKAVVTLSP